MHTQDEVDKIVKWVGLQDVQYVAEPKQVKQLMSQGAHITPET